MDSSTALVAAIAAGVPSMVIGVVSYFLRRTLEKVEGSLEKLGVQLSTHDTRVALLEHRVSMLEADARGRKP